MISQIGLAVKNLSKKDNNNNENNNNKGNLVKSETTDFGFHVYKSNSNQTHGWSESQYLISGYAFQSHQLNWDCVLFKLNFHHSDLTAQFSEIKRYHVHKQLSASF